jgi:transcriptional regulator with XRE-family HTH domain
VFSLLSIERTVRPNPKALPARAQSSPAVSQRTATCGALLHACHAHLLQLQLFVEGRRPCGSVQQAALHLGTTAQGVVDGRRQEQEGAAYLWCWPLHQRLCTGVCPASHVTVFITAERMCSQNCESMYNAAETQSPRDDADPEGDPMKLTPFGEKVRHLRMRYDASLKSMAEALQISSSYLSGIEYGERRLSDKHVEGALAFFEGKATPMELAELQEAAERSKDLITLDSLSPDARGLVAAFARRLQEGDAPTPEIRKWIEKKGRVK